MGELIHVNTQLQERLVAQTKESERLLKFNTEKEGAYESLLHQIQNQEIDENEPQTVRPTSEEAGNGAGFFQIFTPVGRHSQVQGRVVSCWMQSNPMPRMPCSV